jgi:hypothetical protein
MSPQKHAAQIANAKLANGAVTEEGRRRSSANSTRHGLASRKLRIIPPEDREEFDELCSTMLPALAPEGPIENHLADLIVFDEWRMIRTRGLENEIFAMGFTKAKDEFFAGAEVWLAHAKELATLTLYEQRIGRVLTRNKAELETRQTARKTIGADLLVCDTPMPHSDELRAAQSQQPEAPPAAAEHTDSEPETSAPAETLSNAPTTPETIGGFVRSSAAAESPANDVQVPNLPAKQPETPPTVTLIPQGALRNAA